MVGCFVFYRMIKNGDEHWFISGNQSVKQVSFWAFFYFDKGETKK